MVDQHNLVCCKTAGDIGVQTSSAGWTSGNSGSAWLTDDVTCLAAGDGEIPWDLVANWTDFPPPLSTLTLPFQQGHCWNYLGSVQANY